MDAYQRDLTVARMLETTARLLAICFRCNCDLQGSVVLFSGSVDPSSSIENLLFMC